MFACMLARRIPHSALKTSLRSYVTMFGDHCPLVITPAQFHNLKASPTRPTSSDVVVLDASWHMPNSPRKADSEYLASHIPSAKFLDIDRVASPHPLSLPHMMPDPKTFVEACSKFGITAETHVVIYDTHGVFSSPRALYMFRAFGHHRSSILDGGLPGWQAHGGQTENGESESVQSSEYPTPELDKDVVKDYEQMVANADLNPATNAGAFFVLDARPRGRFLGVDPEPRPGLSSGHMPYAVSLPFNAFVETHTVPEHVASKLTDRPVTYTRLRSNQGILSAIESSLGVDRAREVLEGKRQVVTSCGSGMTAGILWLGLKLLGVERVGLYDESWTGYAMRKESKIVKGE